MTANPSNILIASSPKKALNRVRVGAVSYLNSQPLVHQLGDRSEEIDLVYDFPSRLADRLSRGELDVALIPSFEYFRNPGYRIVSDACIACHGPVLSVKLLSRIPMDRIQTLALDEGSRSSAVMVRVLLKAQFGLSPRLQLLPYGADLAQIPSDSVLLIGDRAIHPPADRYQEIWDLGEQWCQWSGLPFVFAMWVARPGLEVVRLEAFLSESRDAGVANLERIAKSESPGVGLTYEQTLCYLRDNLHFYLGPREQQGLERFHRCAAGLGLCPRTIEEGVYDFQAS
jgi:chorismate dehydratase